MLKGSDKLLEKLEMLRTAKAKEKAQTTLRVLKKNPTQPYKIPCRSSAVCNSPDPNFWMRKLKNFVQPLATSLWLSITHLVVVMGLCDVVSPVSFTADLSSFHHLLFLEVKQLGFPNTAIILHDLVTNPN